MLVLTGVTTMTGQRLVSGSDDTTLKIWSTERASGKWGALKPLTLGLFRSAGRSISPFWWCDTSDPSVFGGSTWDTGCLWKDIWNPGMVENSWQKSTRSVQTNWCHWIQWSWNGIILDTPLWAHFGSFWCHSSKCMLVMKRRCSCKLA